MKEVSIIWKPVHLFAMNLISVLQKQFFTNTTLVSDQDLRSTYGQAESYPLTFQIT